MHVEDENNRLCLFCKTPLPAEASIKQKYCSKEHMWRMNNLRRKGLSDIEIQEIAKKDVKGFCRFCNSETTASKKFCSYEHWNLFRYYKGKGFSQQEIFNVAKEILNRKECLLCGKSLEGKSGKTKFCCKKHYRFYRYHSLKGLTFNTIKSIFKESKK